MDIIEVKGQTNGELTQQTCQSIYLEKKELKKSCTIPQNQISFRTHATPSKVYQ